jgi:hypothetical protein
MAGLYPIHRGGVALAAFICVLILGLLYLMSRIGSGSGSISRLFAKWCQTLRLSIGHGGVSLHLRIFIHAVESPDALIQVSPVCESSRIARFPADASAWSGTTRQREVSVAS